jgi:hypothetical protein
VLGISVVTHLLASRGGICSVELDTEKLQLALEHVRTGSMNCFGASRECHEKATGDECRS